MNEPTNEEAQLKNERLLNWQMGAWESDPRQDFRDEHDDNMVDEFIRSL